MILKGKCLKKKKDCSANCSVLSKNHQKLDLSSSLLKILKHSLLLSNNNLLLLLILKQF